VTDVRDSVLLELIRCDLAGGLTGSSLYPRLVEAALGEGLDTHLASQLERAGHLSLAVALQVRSYPCQLVPSIGNGTYLYCAVVCN
jgi:hypothetical protein